MNKPYQSAVVWSFRLKNARNGFLVLDEHDNQVCDVFMTNLPIIAEERAQLIATVPELLVALQLAQPVYCSMKCPSVGKANHPIPHNRYCQYMQEVLVKAGCEL